MTEIEKFKIIDLISDLSRGDVAIVNELKQFLQKTTYTSEEVGFHIEKNETKNKITFFKMISLMETTNYLSYAEDKYIIEIFKQWVGPQRLNETPEVILKLEALIQKANSLLDAKVSQEDVAKTLLFELKALITDFTKKIEILFESTGFPILTLDTGISDTTYFVHVDKKTADKWRGVSFGFCKNGIEFGVRAPNWQRFWDNLCYTLMLPKEDVPKELLARPFRHE